MIAEMLSVGTELLLGEIVDTNSAWLAEDLAERGVDVLWSQRVGDNLSRICQAIELALSRSDVLVMCGGLGPTDDDMSREAIAQVMAETAEIDARLEADLRARFATFSRHMPERNLKQAWLIPSAESLANPVGTAPGRFVRRGKKIIIALPGPPRELKRMWQHEVIPKLELPSSAFYSRIYKTNGIGESSLAESLGELTLSANPSVATYAKTDGVHVRVAAKAGSMAAAEKLAQPALAHVESILADYIWGYDRDELPALITDKLSQKGQSLALSEGFSGGLLSHLLTGTPNAHALAGSVVAYADKAKLVFGNAPEDSPELYSEQQAKAAAQQFVADYGLATSDLVKLEAEEGKFRVHLAVYTSDEVSNKVVTLPPLSLAWMRERITYAALALMWSQLRP